MEKQLYNLQSLREIVDNDEEEVKEMVQMFLDLAPATHSEMKEAYEEKNFEELGKLAHKLKTSIRLMEIAELEEEVLAVEKNSKENRNLNELGQLMDKINDVLPKAICQIRETVK